MGPLEYGVLQLALSPLLLPLLPHLAGKSLLDAFAEYRRSGAWPRNKSIIDRMKKRQRDRVGRDPPCVLAHVIMAA